MTGEYLITRSGRNVGSAKVERQGLYYRITCFCRLPPEEPYKIRAKCGTVHADIGVCVPEGNAFYLKKSIPAKRLGEGELAFFAVPCGSDTMDGFIAVEETEPFPYLSQLTGACLDIRSGVSGIVLKKD